MDEQKLKNNCIDWNKQQFYRAINEERWRDAARYKGNIERLLGVEERA